MQYYGARLRAYDTDVIQLFKALADFTQPRELQKTLVAFSNNDKNILFFDIAKVESLV